MLCNDLEVIPGCFAPSLHLGQIVVKLVKVHLTTISQTELITDCSRFFLMDMKVGFTATTVEPAHHLLVINSTWTDMVTLSSFHFRNKLILRTNCLMSFEKVNNLGQAGDGSYLRVEVSAVWKLLHHDGAGMVQQGLLMNCVLHLWDFLQVIQLKAFCLEMHAYTATQSECGTETTV